MTVGNFLRMCLVGMKRVRGSVNPLESIFNPLDRDSKWRGRFEHQRDWSYKVVKLIKEPVTAVFHSASADTRHPSQQVACNNYGCDLDATSHY
ncbi:hypothetical protein EVAR_79234_1 [Eumeta japonica]|uniref:Uncharacterized protein n=1 Tax=Eumeta variegata TaxID=151549 RepID=A0A4C1Z9W8_EUMVA|nr:hypothetical protein EVAR_79234_1 [Eumeta japonica]